MADISAFLDSIKNKNTKIGIIGLGYVGLPLGLEFCEKKFQVVGFDIDDEKIGLLLGGKSYIQHIPSDRIKKAVDSECFTATSDFTKVSEVDAILICVPTPLTGHREPDMSFIVSTAKHIAPYIKENQLITLESTTYPGTTEQLLKPILEEGSGLMAGEDFWIAFSPEREDPNNPNFNTSTIPKVVGGLTRDGLRAATNLYGEIVVRTIPVSSCAAAEATKLLENIFRAVNIALVNELKMIFHRMNIDIWEVIDAAKSKPFGFMPFYPGPGLGGHCIPIDPFYLTWKAIEYGINTRFIELAGEINALMPDYVVMRAMEEMNEIAKPLKGSKVLIVGMAYKPNVDDMRESPSLKLWELFEKRGAEVSYYDPHIPVIPKTREHPELAGKKSIDISEIDNFQLAVIATNHKLIDHRQFAEKCDLVIDTRNALDKIKYKNVKQA